MHYSGLYGIAQSVSGAANLLVYSKGPGFKHRLGTHAGGPLAEQQQRGISSAFPVTRMTDTKTKTKKRANNYCTILYIGIQPATSVEGQIVRCLSKEIDQTYLWRDAVE